MDAHGDFERVDVTNIPEPFSAHLYFMRKPSLSGRGSALKKSAPAQVKRAGQSPK
jgi:polyphosphate kinase